MILPFLFYLAVTAFTTAYAAYPIIDRYMIAPYVNPNADEDTVTDDAEPSADTATESAES